MKAILIFALLALALSTNIFLDQESLVSEVNKVQKNWVAGHNRYFDGRTM